MVSVKKRVAILAVLLLLIVAGFLVWRWAHSKHAPADTITLYGNVDIRQVQLAFNDSERIDKLLVDEGSAIHAGELIAQLVQQRFLDAVAQDKATMAAQQQVVARLLAGSRPEEIAQARADVAAAQADVVAAQANVTNAELLYRRQQTLAKQQYVSLQIRDDAERSYQAEQANLAAKKQALVAKEQVLRLAVIGPRKEDIAQAQAMLDADEAQVALLDRELADAQLRAPLDAVVRSRIAEPGDMASPQKTAFTLAITNPKWVRAYVSETDLGRVRPGLPATVEVDSFPGKRFQGWVGFISPVAEFTPKTVETQELRTSLVYEIRVFVKDPGDLLRLGMPATVYLSPARPRT